MYQRISRTKKSTSVASTTNPFTPSPFQVQPVPEQNLIQEKAPESKQYESLLKPIAIFAPGTVPPPAPKLQLQMKLNMGESQNTQAASPDIEAEIRQAQSSGQPISDNIRLPMEQAFGADFSRVKIHTDAQSDQLNHSIQARAFTTGKDVFFRQGEYNPGSQSGQELLAHELTHVVQQNAHTVQREKASIAISGEPDNTIQRNIENETYKDTDATNIAAAKLFFQLYDEAAQKAYTYATTVPSLGGYENLNGYTQLWVQKWNEHLSGGRPNLMAATFGYVIESLVSDSKSEFCPKISGGYSVDTQVTSGGTRPDLVLRLSKGTAHIAWLDMTAAKSVDHIYLKDDWLSKVLNFAEVTYPSLDPAILAFMKQNKDNKGSMTKEEFEKKLAAAKEEYKIQKQKWLEIGKDFAYTKLGSKVTTRDKETKKLTKVPKEIQRLQPEIPREFIRKKLNAYFDTDEPIQEKMVPSILKALGVNPTSWGYTTGYSISEKAGEAWLIDNPVSDES